MADRFVVLKQLYRLPVEELNLWFPLPDITGTLTGPKDISSEGIMIRLPVKDEPRQAFIRFGVLTVEGSFSKVLSGFTFHKV